MNVADDLQQILIFVWFPKCNFFASLLLATCRNYDDDDDDDDKI